jgi:hypothetical protein
MPTKTSRTVSPLSRKIMPTKKPTTQTRTISPLSTATSYDDSDTSMLEPSDDESDSVEVEVEVEEEEGSDEQLMDDARPGRRVKGETRKNK